MDGVILTEEKKISNLRGDIFHFIKKNDVGYSCFGECYFSFIHFNEVKGWKKHNEMVLNLVVPIGKIKFVIYNPISNDFFEVTLSKNNYKRLTVMPGLWMAFKGIEKINLLSNFASIKHEPNESENLDLNQIKYNWKKD